MIRETCSPAVEVTIALPYASGNFGDNGIWWNKIQGARYLHYAQQNNVPAYIAIGIEGNPKSPETMALIPIEVMQKQYPNFIPKKIIEQYPRASYTKENFLL